MISRRSSGRCQSVPVAQSVHNHLPTRHQPDSRKPFHRRSILWPEVRMRHPSPTQPAPHTQMPPARLPNPAMLPRQARITKRTRHLNENTEPPWKIEPEQDPPEPNKIPSRTRAKPEKTRARRSCGAESVSEALSANTAINAFYPNRPLHWHRLSCNLKSWSFREPSHG